MQPSGGYQAHVLRAEAELLSSHDTHQVIADRLGISADAYGFNLTNPAVVYVLHHPALGAVKVGITGGDERTTKYVRNGWTLKQTADYATGAAAWAIEQAVLQRIREEMSLNHFLTAEQMGAQGGWTETFDANLLPPDDLLQLVEQERSKLQFR